MDASDSVIRLGVVIPLSNEEATVTELLKRVSLQLSDNDRVFCVVDHSSKDETRRLVEEYALKDLRVLLVWAPENQCVVDAYFAGYRAAIEAGAQWILEMDGGFSHLPEEIPSVTMLQGWRQASRLLASVAEHENLAAVVGQFRIECLRWLLGELSFDERCKRLLASRSKVLNSGPPGRLAHNAAIVLRLTIPVRIQ